MLAMTELRFNRVSFGQMGFMYSRLEELELCNSPQSKMNGCPSTTSWVAGPSPASRGMPESPAQTSKGAKSRVGIKRNREARWV